MKMYRIILYSLILSAGLGAPAFATQQWATGTVVDLQECGTTGCGGYNVMLTMSNITWLGGASPSGATVCPSVFRITTGVLGIDENSKNRMFSILLTAYAQHGPVSILVDTSVQSNFCPIQAVSTGSTP